MIIFAEPAASRFGFQRRASEGWQTTRGLNGKAPWLGKLF